MPFNSPATVRLEWTRDARSFAVYSRSACTPEVVQRELRTFQQNACHAAALAEDPSVIVLGYHDDEVSGHDVAPPQLAQLLADIESGAAPIRRLYVNDSLRLSRDFQRLGDARSTLASRYVAPPPAVRISREPPSCSWRTL